MLKRNFGMQTEEGGCRHGSGYYESVCIRNNLFESTPAKAGKGGKPCLTIKL